jgi:predicted  nucleic acid-binding Zn-ribbon protein
MSVTHTEGVRMTDTQTNGTKLAAQGSQVATSYSRHDVDERLKSKTNQLAAATAELDQLKGRMTDLDRRKAKAEQTIVDKRAEIVSIDDERTQLELLISAEHANVSALSRAVATLSKTKLREGAPGKDGAK